MKKDVHCGHGHGTGNCAQEELNEKNMPVKQGAVEAACSKKDTCCKKQDVEVEEDGGSCCE